MASDEKLNLDLYQNLSSNQAPEDFHHVAFKTTNYEAMIDFYIRLFGCEPLYKSEELTFLAFDEEHHRVAIANTSVVFENLGFIPKTIMRIKNWMNKTLPSIVGLDHISYKLNPIDKWFGASAHRHGAARARPKSLRQWAAGSPLSGSLAEKRWRPR